MMIQIRAASIADCPAVEAIVRAAYDTRERIPDARSVLGREHAVLASFSDVRETVGHADADALLPAEDGANADFGAGVDQRVARIAGEEFGSLALQDFRNNTAPFTCFPSFVSRLCISYRRAR